MTTPTAGSDGPSENRTPSTLEPTTQQKPLQFDMQSLLWLTVTVSIALMYLRPFGQGAVLEAAGVIAVAATAAVVVGTMRGQIGEVLYWSVLGAAFAFISAATGHLAHWTAPFAWAAVGSVTGCTVACLGDSPWPRSIVAGGLAAGLVMGLYAAFLYRFTGQFEWFDLASSIPIGAGFGLLVAVLRLVQRRSSLRYDAVATVLMAAIVAGNYLSKVVAPIAVLAAVICLLPGCGQPASTVDPAPFEAAVANYLTKNDMALRLKEIRQGPAVDGDQATMTASMTHRELGGPSVVWTFQFQRAGKSEWKVVSHE